MSDGNEKFRFSIDRGGTFTDIYAEVPGGRAIVRKLLSVDPSNYRDAPTEGIRRILEEFTGSIALVFRFLQLVFLWMRVRFMAIFVRIFRHSTSQRSTC